MLEIRPTCENCNKKLPFDAKDAMICTFECTFCKTCVETVLQHVCPNCGGDFVKRPIRPKQLLEKYPISTKIVFKPVDIDAHNKLLQRLKIN
ncbi:hypothetical protein PW52_00350 [Tamlana sedimentorum]|uniref:Urease n=1 Tax=Neotamlana sedimentorum TaxID=1435349 RepID=A0A0D7WGR7_9FLAO|nr:DUF1272 domain-containing protein [Tamlana sedimentorum]KJD36947.1 hypothetical protein PW52_00350 [Tamlana sedimentorum]